MIPKADRALYRCGCSTLATYFSLRLMDVMSTKAIIDQRKCICIEFAATYLHNLVNMHYFSEGMPPNPVELSSQNFRDSLTAEWQQFTTSPPNSITSSNLKFGNAYDGFKQSSAFENLIALLKDVNPKFSKRRRN